MGERFNIWWLTMENFQLPLGRIVLKTIFVTFLMSAILSADSPWYANIVEYKLFIFKSGMFLLLLCYVYPDLKQVYLHFKSVFSSEKKTI